MLVWKSKINTGKYNEDFIQKSNIAFQIRMRQLILYKHREKNREKNRF